MNRNELLTIGDASVLRALADMYAILNGNGEILTTLGGDRMLFSPRLECDDGCSTVLFDDEDKANGVIEEILMPQDGDGEYHVYKFTSVGDPECCAGCEGGLGTADGECGEMTLDDAIEHCYEVAATCGDEGCAAQHEQLAAWLEELKAFKDDDIEDAEDSEETEDPADAEDDEDDEDDEKKREDSEDEDEDEDEDEEDALEESVGKSPTMREAHRVFKHNGYTMVSQRGSHQKWTKPGDPTPIILPYHSRDNEQVRPCDWKRIVKEHNLDLSI